MGTAPSDECIRWNDLLGRDPEDNDLDRLSGTLQGKRILITGGAGYIGSALARAVQRIGPERLVLVDMAESGIDAIERQLAQSGDTSTVCVLGSITDFRLLSNTLAEHKPDIVFHCAAFKSVPLLERHPFAAVENNAIATARVATLAAEHGCRQFILVSTDKAADPVSVLGASKRIAELATLARSGSGTLMKAVRLGNVLGSPGSIVPLFGRQIANGEPVTVTDPRSERYFMTADEAASVLCNAALPLRPSGIYIPDIGPAVQVMKLVRHMFTSIKGAAGPHDTVIIGLRPGDKICESMIAGNESSTETDRLGYGGIRLHSVAGPSISEASVNAAIHAVERSLQGADLDGMLQQLFALVPSYVPSAALLAKADDLRRVRKAVSR